MENDKTIENCIQRAEPKCRKIMKKTDFDRAKEIVEQIAVLEEFIDALDQMVKLGTIESIDLKFTADYGEERELSTGEQYLIDDIYKVLRNRQTEATEELEELKEEYDELFKEQ